jgi:hypothetical protein
LLLYAGVGGADVPQAPSLHELHPVAVSTTLTDLEKFPDYAFFVEGERCVCREQKRSRWCVQFCTINRASGLTKNDFVVWGSTREPLARVYAVLRRDPVGRRFKIFAGIKQVPARAQNWNETATVEQVYRVTAIGARGMRIELSDERYRDRQGAELSRESIQRSFQSFKDNPQGRRDKAATPNP